MGCAVGLEGGGTKTACLIADDDLRILGHGLGGPTNRYFVSAAVAARSVLDAFRAAVGRCSPRPKKIDVLCMAFADPQVQGRLRRVIPVDRVITSSEDEVARTANLPGGFGVVVIAGTGSMARAVNRKGQAASAGGWGPILGDEGSAVDIAMKAILAAIRSTDGREQPTRLPAAVIDYFGLDDLGGLIPLFYQRGVPRHRIGGLFRQVLRLAREGDPVARRIIRDAGKELGILAAGAARRAGMQRQAFDVVVCGGVAQAGPLVMPAVARQVKKVAPRARIWPERLPPVCGALLLAYREMGFALDQAARARLRASMREAGLHGWPSRAVMEGGLDVSATMA